MLGQLILVGIVAGIGIVVGFILIIVPGLILITIWSVAAPVVVLEHPGVFAALRRSRELVRGNGWQVFGVILVLYILVGVVSIIIEGAAESAGSGAGIVVRVIVGVLTAPLSALAASVLYFELRGAPAAGGAPGVGGPGSSDQGGDAGRGRHRRGERVRSLTPCRRAASEHQAARLALGCCAAPCPRSTHPSCCARACCRGCRSCSPARTRRTQRQTRARPAPDWGRASRSACAGLGARVFECELSSDGPDGQEEAAVERAAQEAVERALADAGSVELLAVDGASVFAQAGAGGSGDARRRCARASMRAGTSRAPSPPARSCPTNAAGASSTWRRRPAAASTPMPRARASRTSRGRSRSSGPATRSPPSRSPPARPPHRARWPR